MLNVFVMRADNPIAPIHEAAADLERFLAGRSESERRWLTTTGFKAGDGEIALSRAPATVWRAR